ncbi:MAG TPA: CPBP family intramembrane glutamic endopeptidase [Candidatus Dormibacteraeota bacterium]|nr:CPBP family intramembrane glutamic endopeptidase [Candidatus Dormibacteraeota bacterium]
MFGVTFAYIYGLPAPYPVVWFLGIFSPTIAGLLIALLSGGRPAAKAMLVGFTRLRLGVRWYLAALSLVLVPLAIALVYIAIGNPARGLLPGVTAWALLGQFVYTLFSGPLAEEAGWRGFALPRLEARHSALTSSLILGTLWAGWHIPLYFQGGSAAPGIPFPIYLVMVVVLATLLTFLYNNTGGSLVITVLAHFSFNLTSVFVTGAFGLIPMNVFFMTAGPALGLMVVIVVAYFGPRYLSRKPVDELPFQKTTSALSAA